MHGAWLSLVERVVRDYEVAGSNPVAPIYHRTSAIMLVSLFFAQNGGFAWFFNRRRSFLQLLCLFYFLFMVSHFPDLFTKLPLFFFPHCPLSGFSK